MNPPDTCADTFDQASEQDLAEASAWFARRRAGQTSTADDARWHAWLAASPGHREAWQLVERVGQRFAAVRSSDARDPAVHALRQAQQPRAGRRRLLAGAMAAITAGAAGWAIHRPASLPAWMQAWTSDAATGVGEIRQMRLADGSDLWLNAMSAIDLAFTNDLRRVRLKRGEIRIATRPDARRGFEVVTPQGRLRALGTRFTVRLDSESTLVAVFDGAVAVGRPEGVETVIPAGRQARLTRQGVAALQPAEAARDAWSRGILIADGTPLGDVVRELDRYFGGWIQLDAKAAALPVYGSYPALDPRRTLAMLASVMPLEVHEPVPGWLRIGLRR